MLCFLLGFYVGGVFCHAGVLLNARYRGVGLSLPYIAWVSLIWFVVLLVGFDEELDRS
jgi:hypothetical protein